MYVLANGCSDSTEDIVKKLCNKNTSIRLISLCLADKANAWNYIDWIAIYQMKLKEQKYRELLRR